MAWRSVVVNLGVHIGNSAVVGSESIITKNIIDNVIAVGSSYKFSCKVTEEERKYYYKNYEFEVEDYKN